jgi:hypothetical protein
MKKDKLVNNFIIGTFVSLYLLVSIISTIHVIDFFKLSNPTWLAVSLAIGFELGAAASLASIIALKKMNKTIVWILFFVITAMQMQGNMYYAFVNLQDFQSWSELFNLIEEDLIYQKRVLAAVSGAILPLVALGFIKSLVDYIKPEEDDVKEEDNKTGYVPSGSVFDDLEDLIKEEESEVFGEEVEEPLHDPIEAHEEWDEDHALDLVLNDMVKDMDSDVINEILEGEDFEVEEREELQDAWSQDFEIEDDEEVIQPKKSIDLFDIANSGASVADAIENQEEEDLDLLEQALREKGRKEMDSFLKEKEDDKKNSDRSE